MEPLSVGQRKERLAELIALVPTPDKVTIGHIVSAIDIYNRMTNTYDQPMLQDNRQINILIQGGEETKAKVQELLSGNMPPLEQLASAEPSQAVVTEEESDD